MKELIKSVVIWVLIICIIPAFANAAAKTDEAAKTASEAVSAPVPTVYEINSDRLIILDREKETTRTVSVEEYAVNAVLSQIPFLLADEALKAQVCAARTYAVRRIAAGRDSTTGAHITDDESLYQICPEEAVLRTIYGNDYDMAYAAVKKAAEETEDMIILHDGCPVTAAFHTSSGGMTESAENVWGKALPYLVPVSSPENEAYEKNFTSAELRARINAVYPEAGSFEGLTVEEVTPSGTVIRVTAGNASLSGMEIARILTLDSAAFEISQKDDDYTFTVSGCGHLCGMSMTGADIMARQGSTYEEILTHYYTGVTVAPFRRTE